MSDPGPAIRVHGDYHLGQVMETDSGWYVLDFEGEPAKSLAERIAPTSPLKDVSAMLRSLDYASRYALTERAAVRDGPAGASGPGVERPQPPGLSGGVSGRGRDRDLLPGPGSAPAVVFAHELDKALYELDYERAHRPDWVLLPLAAINQLLEWERMMSPSSQELQQIARGHHADPHRVLGRHGDVVRAFRPDTAAMRLITGPAAQATATDMTRVHPAGIYEGAIDPEVEPLPPGGGLPARRGRAHLSLR